MTYNLTVDFISEFAGNHRICWRIGAGLYDCATIVPCTGNGTACAALIVLNLEDNSCDEVEFNGYVQAQCHDISSLEGRIPFDITFTPSPACDYWKFSCTGSVVALESKNLGSGYVQGATIAINFATTGGGGGAIANAHIGNDSIDNLTNVNAGTGYPVDGIYYNVATIPGGGNPTAAGTGFEFGEIEIVGGIVVNWSTAIMSDAGQNYALTETIILDPGVVGAPVTPAIFQVVALFNNDEMAWIELVNPGANYDEPVTATLASGNATISDVILTGCSGFNIERDNCEGNPFGAVGDTRGGLTIATCALAGQEPPIMPPNWVFSDVGCCYTCESLSIEKTSEVAVTGFYTDCTTKVITPFSINVETPVVLCMIIDSFFIISGSADTTNLGVCP
jgi:hypothetical protein